MVDKIRVQMMEMAAKRKIDAALCDTPYCLKVQKIIKKKPSRKEKLSNPNKEAISQYVSAFYSTEVYRAAYERNIQPIPTFDMPDPPQPSDVLIKPPTTKRLPGRPRKRRIHSRGEVDHAYICSRCKQIGHNRRTYSNPPHNLE
ncbi:hypothetical protein Taro_004409 [Colocasia esculenta]|uniref:Uncharacterized protein n=1 Tax=Colocasia esculenta TaxID=4460 RepID=A0A843TUT8_COLES|nr:hypothetical protein [Colocasia esculenta]